MCDFRHDPTGIRKIDTGEIFPVETKWIWHNEIGSVVTAGMYGISATGSYCQYFDGKEWHHEASSYNKENYEFLRPEGTKMSFGCEHLDFKYINDRGEIIINRRNDQQ